MKRRAVLVGALATGGCLRLSDGTTETDATTERATDDGGTGTTATTDAGTGEATAEETTEAETTTEPAPPETEWPQFQADAGNTGHVPDAVGPTEAPELAWQVAGAGTGTAVADGVAYTGANLTAVGVDGGATVFETRYGESAPAVGDGVVVVGGRNAVVALASDTGERAWEATVEGTVTAPTVADGVAYAGNDDDYDEGFTVGVHAFDAATGRERWTAETETGVESPIAVVDGAVYAVLVDRTLVALDAADGSERWRVDDVSRFSAPTVADSTVYIAGDGDRDGQLLALDAADGSEQWSLALGGDVHASPAVTDDRAYVGTTDDRAVYAVDRADGSEQWRASVDGWALGSPAVTGDTVYVGTRNGVVHALAAADGTERFALDVSDETLGSPTVASGRLLVAADDATYAYR